MAASCSAASLMSPQKWLQQDRGARAGDSTRSVAGRPAAARGSCPHWSVAATTTATTASTGLALKSSGHSISSLIPQRHKSKPLQWCRRDRLRSDMPTTTMMVMIWLDLLSGRPIAIVAGPMRVRSALAVRPNGKGGAWRLAGRLDWRSACHLSSLCQARHERRRRRRQRVGRRVVLNPFGIEKLARRPRSTRRLARHRGRGLSFLAAGWRPFAAPVILLFSTSSCRRWSSPASSSATRARASATQSGTGRPRFGRWTKLESCKTTASPSRVSGSKVSLAAQAFCRPDNARQPARPRPVLGALKSGAGQAQSARLSGGIQQIFGQRRVVVSAGAANQLTGNGLARVNFSSFPFSRLFLRPFVRSFVRLFVCLSGRPASCQPLA
jgi:hypothetical protein